MRDEWTQEYVKYSNEVLSKIFSANIFIAEINAPRRSLLVSSCLGIFLNLYFTNINPLNTKPIS